MTKRINFWSSPRNISTALMYSFAQRSDTTVVDEPLYAHYLSQNLERSSHPVEEEIIATMERNGELVVNNIILGNYDRPVVLFKQMTHHLIGLDLSFLEQTLNVLLIRDPKFIIASYSKITTPKLQGIGVAKQLELFHHLQSIGRLTAIVDSKELLKNPRKILGQLCNRLGLEFEESMLTWSAGARPEDGCWAKYWYKNVHQSTGFQPYVEKQVELSASQEELAKVCQPYYEKLFDQALKA